MCMCSSCDFTKFRCVVQIKREHIAEHVLLVSMTAETGDAQKLVGRCRFIVFLRNLNTLILRFKYEALRKTATS